MFNPVIPEVWHGEVERRYGELEHVGRRRRSSLDIMLRAKATAEAWLRQQH